MFPTIVGKKNFSHRKTIDIYATEWCEMINLARPSLDEREKEAVCRVLDSGWIMQGRTVTQFERAIAEFCGVEHCIAISSGTAALHVCILALDLKPGTAVFIPSFAWPSAANVTRLIGAKPVFVDSNSSTYNLDTQDLANKLTYAADNGERLSLIVPVHQFGIPCDMGRVLSLADVYNMDVLEDSACALGSFCERKHVGTHGRAGVFSFHPRKVISTGEGGAIITRDSGFAKRCRALLNHGNLAEPGLNYRMTDIQAAIGCVQMEKFSDTLRKRKKLLRLYADLLAGGSGYSLPSYLPDILREEGDPVSLQTFMVLLDDSLDRDRVIMEMAEAHIEAKPGSVATHVLPAYRPSWPGTVDPCPTASTLHNRGLALPLHPGLSRSEVSQVVETLKRIVAGVEVTP